MTGLGGGLLLSTLLAAGGGGGAMAAAPSPPEPAARLAPAPDSTVEPIIVELRLGRIAGRTVQAWRRGNEALLPLTQFFDLAEIRATVDRTGRLSGFVEPGHIPVSVDAGADTARYGVRWLVLAPTDVEFRDHDVYLASSVLGRLLELEIDVSWEDLTVTVRNPERLPVALRRDREAREAALLRRHAAAGPELVVAAPSGGWNGMVLDYSAQAAASDPLGSSSWSLAAGTDLLRGSLELGLRGTGAGSRGETELDGSWLGVWRDRPWLRQLRIGDGLATGLEPRNLRGLMITNAPYVRPSLVGQLQYRGRLPAGWQVAAWRGGTLMGLDSVGADGAFGISLPIGYGENPVDLVAYGPWGEQRVIRRTYRVSGALLPRGQFEYGISGGACRLAACRATGNLDLRYGVASRWTLDAGADRIWRDSVSGGFHPYGVLAGSPADAWTVEADVVGDGYLRGSLDYEPTLDLHLGAQYTEFTGTGADPFLNPLGRTRQVLLSGFVRPNPRRDDFYVQAAAELGATPLGSTTRARVDLSFGRGGARLVPYGRLERDGFPGGGAVTRGFVGVNAYLFPSGRWGSLFRQTWLRAGYESEGLGVPASASLGLSRTLSGALRMEAGVTWLRGVPGPTWTLSLTSAFRELRAFTSASAAPGAPVGMTQSVQGSVIYDRETRSVSLAAGPALQRGGVSGRVFVDLNGNGRYDPGEPGAPRVRVQVGTEAGYTDSTGAYRVWDLVPFEPVAVGVDTLSLPSPLWVPTWHAVAVAPGPNRYTSVDLPLQMGAAIEGRVVRVRGGVEEPLAGVSFALARRGGGPVYRGATFSDGTFYVLGVVPGDYDATVAPRALALLDLVPAGPPERFTVRSDGTGPAELVLRLAPK